MRVEPELTQNLKFRRLKLAVGDVAMECLVTIWAHCQQNQRGEYWPLANAEYVEMLCNWTGKAGELYRALVECGRPKVGFLIPEDGGLRVHQWEEMNSQMVGNWQRNPKGRRGKVENRTLTPTGNPPGSQRLPLRLEPNANPMGNRTVTPTVHAGFPDGSENPPETGVGQMAESAGMTGLGAGSNGSEPGSQREANANRTLTRTGNPPGSQRTVEPVSLSFCLGQVPEVLDFLNALTGAEFELPLFEQEEIAARLLAVNGDLEGVKKMLRRQCALWKTDARAAGWLKPSTLFGPKFHDYYGQRHLSTLPPAGSERKPRGQQTADRTELLETLAATRAALEENPTDAALQHRVRELELQTA